MEKGEGVLEWKWFVFDPLSFKKGRFLEEKSIFWDLKESQVVVE